MRVVFLWWTPSLAMNPFQLTRTIISSSQRQFAKFFSILPDRALIDQQAGMQETLFCWLQIYMHELRRRIFSTSSEQHKMCLKQCSTMFMFAVLFSAVQKMLNFIRMITTYPWYDQRVEGMSNMGLFCSVRSEGQHWEDLENKTPNYTLKVPHHHTLQSLQAIVGFMFGFFISPRRPTSAHQAFDSFIRRRHKKDKATVEILKQYGGIPPRMHWHFIVLEHNWICSSATSTWRY